MRLHAGVGGVWDFSSPVIVSFTTVNIAHVSCMSPLYVQMAAVLKKCGKYPFAPENTNDFEVALRGNGRETSENGDVVNLECETQ